MPVAVVLGPHDVEWTGLLLLDQNRGCGLTAGLPCWPHRHYSTDMRPVGLRLNEELEVTEGG